MPSNPPSLFSRPWVLVTTGFIAAYSSYVIWSNWPSKDTSPNLRRRGAVRTRNHPRDHTRIWTSSPSEPSLPFGLLNVDFEGILVRFPNGPAPPTVVEIQEALNLPNSSAFDLTIKIQEAALEAIFAILTQPDEALSAEQSESSRDLRELIPLLRQPNIDELLAKIHMLCSGSWKFHQAAVARAFANLCGLDSLPTIPDDTEQGLSETSADSDHQDDRGPAQGVKSLVYNIAQEEAIRRLYVHTGIRCEQCGQYPILGVRWHCNNCPEFDLCSTCEAHPMHPKTHLFTKIKVPLSYLGQNHQVSDPWYPGDSMAEWPSLGSSLKKQLATDSGFDDLTIQVFYDQFGCKANVSYPEDQMQIGLAVDRHAFNKLMMSPTWERPVEPSFLYDRMFNFYDTDNNGLIGFKEYVLGMSYLRRIGNQTSMDRIFNGYDLDGDGYIGRRDFVRMLSAKYAVQKNIVGDMITAAEFDMVGYSAKVVQSSQPISAAFAQEDVPPGHTRAPTMKTPDRFGENQVRPDAGPFNSAVLPDGLEIPDSSLVSAVAHRYGVEILPSSIALTDTLPMEYLTEFTNNLNRSDSVAIEGAEDEDVQRFMVEADSRRTRGQTTIDGPEHRWHQDLVDVAQGKTQTLREAPNGGACTAEGDPLPELHVEILERGRAYDVPVAEKDFGTEVIFQVIQEGLNELIDPIFAKKEKLAERVRRTREERGRLRKEIEEFVEEAKAHREELSIGSKVDPLMAIANAANDHEYADIEHEPGEADLGNRLLHVESTDGSERLPTPREIAMDLQEHIAQQSETLNNDLEDLETNIREQSLDDLLAQSGYIVDFSSNTEPSSTTQHDGFDPDSPSTPLAEESPFSGRGENSASLDDMTELEDISTSENNDVSNTTFSTAPDNHSPPIAHLQAPTSTPNMDLSGAVFPPFCPDQTEKTDQTEQSATPSRERLKELARLDEEEKEIVVRGGGGRLNLKEFERVIRSDKNGLLKGVAESWLEWAEF